MEAAYTNDSPQVNFMPPRMFLICLAGGVALTLLLPWHIPVFTLAWRLILGLALAGAGFWFMMWGHGLFQKQGVEVPTNRPASELVRQGAYQFSRNPMYVGFVALLLGIGLALGSGWMMLSAAPMAVYLATYVVPREEAYLARTFGPVYGDYCQEVRRWL